jgi:serine/threonine protein kinase/Tfp pilus assembly protein PilF
MQKQSQADWTESAGGVFDGTETETISGEVKPTSLGPEQSTGIEKIDRYIVGQRIGKGAMGEIYSAIDTELKRKVALKVLKDSGGPRQGIEKLRSGIEREARALARLAHPNVVTVFDVGTSNERVFVSMEYVSGLTVKQWLAKRSPGWKEILAVFLQAGRGLAAAHEAGVVHRDFKPSNVMVGNDGRVRVLDFGVALIPDSEPEAAQAAASDMPAAKRFAVGTPAYTAPELLRGIKASADSDQFSFCAALFEALYGERPFAGRTLADYQDQAQSGEVREPPPGSNVPVWLHRIVLRGLQPNPTARYSSMADLLRALENDPVARWRRWLIRAAGAALAIIAVTASYRLWQQQSQLFESGEIRLEGVWDEQRRQDIRSAFANSGKNFSSVTYATVESILDTYADEWLVQYSRTCEATGRVKGKSDPVLMQRLACLDDRLAELGALTSRLAQADAELVSLVVEAASRLSRVSRCADANILLMGVIESPGDKERSQEIRALRDQLAEVRASYVLKRDTESLSLARSALERATALAEPVLEAESKLFMAKVLLLSGKAGVEETRRLCYECIWAAEAKRADVLVAQAWAVIVSTLNPKDSEAEINRLINFAVAAHERVGESADLKAELYSCLASAYNRLGRYEDSNKYYRQAVGLAEKVGGTESLGHVSNLNDLAVSYIRLGRYAEAVPLLQQTLALKERLIGIEHERALSTIINLGISHAAIGDYDSAAASYEKALAVATRSHNPYLIGKIHNLFGTLEWRRKRYQASLQHLLKSLEILRQVNGKRQVSNAVTLNNIAELYETIGSFDLALEHYSLALEIEEETLEMEHPYLAYPLTGIGRIYLERKEPQKALPALERAVAIRKRSNCRPVDLADSRFALARALAETGETKRSMVLARQAREGFIEAGNDGSEQLGEVDKLLESLEE